MDPRRYLEDLISSFHRQVESDPHSAHAIARAEIQGVASGLVASGVLTQQDKVALLAGLGTTSADSVRTLTQTGAASRDERIRMLRHSAATAARDTSLPTPAGYVAHSDARLARVVPLHHLPEKSDVTLISLELWTTCMALRLAPRNVDSDPITRLAGHSKWRAVDDTGSEYAEFSYYSSDAAGLFVETRMFGPALNASARTLTITASNATGPFELAIPFP